MPLLTVGHGPDDRDRLGGRLRGAGVQELVDVRRFPGSRTNPDVRRETLTEWLPELGIAYRWEERLGGRRRLPPGEPVVDGWWTVAQFAAYAAHTRPAEFTDALSDVLAAAAERTVAVMCSESVWWRCHRRMIADFVSIARGTSVLHLGHSGRVTEHPAAAGARLSADGSLVYDLTEERHGSRG